MYLLKGVTVIDESSPFHQQRVDILLQEGIIANIAPQLPVPAQAKILPFDSAFVSVGWADLGTQIGEPGYESYEDIPSVTKAAFAGGYTTLIAQPNTYPPLQTKADVQFLKNKSENNPVTVLPIAALSQGCEGKELAELYDIHLAGAVAFSDGKHATQHSGLLLRALEYVKAFDGIVINTPSDKLLAANGLIHEGPISTQLGMRGISSMSEFTMVQRDIALLQYTNSKLHIANISTKESVELIRLAKQRGLQISCSVPIMNLIYTDDDLADFDTNLKVFPPLRSMADRAALLAGINEGVIDIISCNHVPVPSELKDIEFAYAKFGAINVQTTIHFISKILSQINIEVLIKCLTSNVRGIFNLPQYSIQQSKPANLTVFDFRTKWVLNNTSNLSKSFNSTLFNTSLQGKILATFALKNAHTAF